MFSDRLIYKKILHKIVVELTGITNTDLLGERPLSVVLMELLSWVDTTTSEVAQSTGMTYFPGIFVPHGLYL